MADHPLEILDKEIETVPASWVVASHLLTPGELKNNFPLVYPKQNLIEWLPLPCVGRFPIQQARKEGWPELDAKARRQLASAIFAKGWGDGGVVVVAS